MLGLMSTPIDDPRTWDFCWGPSLVVGLFSSRETGTPDSQEFYKSGVTSLCRLLKAPHCLTPPISALHSCREGHVWQ